MQHKQYTGLSYAPILILLGMAIIWGANWAVVKMGLREIEPVFMAGIRSLVAGLCLAVWIRAKGLPLFPSKTVTLHGLVIGLIFGSEFTLVYLGLKFTLASRVYVLIYTAPFFTAIGAHFFLPGDRLNKFKVMGLMLAFSGILALFAGSLKGSSGSTVGGDLMIVGAGALWGAMTVYTKKYMTGRAGPFQTLFYQFLFSVPLFFILSGILENNVIHGLSWVGVCSVAFQSIVVAFLSYLVWTVLIFRYPVSLIHSFAFFTPIFGVLISGILLLGEPVGWSLAAALTLVCLGLVLVNKKA